MEAAQINLVCNGCSTVLKSNTKHGIKRNHPYLTFMLATALIHYPKWVCCNHSFARNPSGITREIHKQTTLSAYYSPWPLSLIHISEPTRLLSISYAVFCL